MRALAIVPAYNEARSLPEVVSGLRHHASELDVCVVDDGSSDGTPEVCRTLGVTLLRCPFNLGIGGAVQTGYLWAHERGYDIAVQIDGDCQHDPASVGALLEPLTAAKADLVIGSRFHEGGGFQSTLVRRLGIHYLSWLLWVRCGTRVSDPTSGFRAASRAAIELFASYYPPDYPEPESIAVAVRHGLRVVEVPVRMQARRYGRSSIDAWGSMYYALKVSLALVLLPARRRGVQ
jgi:glycosyltransferase involved in cell wall biosynthesis